MTLTKLAKMANVSVSTASKAFSMSDEISEETRKIVFDVAKENGCFRDFFNAKYGKYVVAIICPETKSIYYSSTVDELCSGFVQKGYGVIVSTNDFSSNSTDELLEYYDKYNKVDAAVFIDVRIPDIKLNVPAVCACERHFSVSADNVSFITTDYSEAYGEAFEHFKSLGITEFGFIGEMLTNNTLNNIREIAAGKGCEFPESFTVFSEERFESGGYKAMELLYAKKKLPKVVFCGYDNMAIGALRCIADFGQKVPEDIMIVGKDDIPECNYCIPRLSTVGFSKSELCGSIIQAVRDLLENGKKTEYEIKTKFIGRQSSL